MTPREIHIAIDLGLQKAGSFAYDNIKDEFKDYAFNRMGDAYIIEKTTRSIDSKQSGFEDNINRLSTIRELVTEANLTVLNQTSQKRQYSLLPYDYMSFIEAYGETVSSCDSSAISFNSSTVVEYISIVPFRKSDFGLTPPSPPFANTRVFKVINTTPVEIFDFSDFSTGLSSIDEIFTVINKILNDVNRQTDLKVYWEHYRESYYPDSFIFVSNSSAYLNQAMRIEYTNSLSTTSNFTITNYTKYNVATTAPVIERDSFCRLVSNEEAYHLLQNPFGTTSNESPLIVLNNYKLDIFINKRFLLKGLVLKYVRKPQRLSLPLNQSYGLQDERALEKIIDMTVEYLAATIESQGYQALTIENSQRD